MSSHSSKFSPIMSRPQRFDVPFTTEESNGCHRTARVIRATDCIMVAERAQWLVLSLTPALIEIITLHVTSTSSQRDGTINSPPNDKEAGWLGGIYIKELKGLTFPEGMPVARRLKF